MQLDEVAKWRPFVPVNGEPIDLSFLDAHSITYVHQEAGKADIEYTFFVTFSFHCFAKDHPDLTDTERSALMYHAPKDSRPFCYQRYHLARRYLRQIIENLPQTSVTHAGFGSYASVEVITETGERAWYYVPFKVYKERKKYRLHVTSAYSISEAPKSGKVGFFTIAHNLRMGKKLPARSR